MNRRRSDVSDTFAIGVLTSGSGIWFPGGACSLSCALLEAAGETVVDFGRELEDDDKERGDSQEDEDDKGDRKTRLEQFQENVHVVILQTLPAGPDGQRAAR